MAFGGFDNHGGSAPMADINTTPLVDVMLVLLVIFILTAPLLTHSIKLDLPAAAAPATDEKPETITVSVDGQNHIFWNNEPVADIDALAARLQGESGKQPQPELHLRADKESRYQTIAEVMSAAQRAGLTKIGFITDPNAQK